ncbi:hypothetical protein EV361DRAFT_955808 [Lentinula raphanica]|nr:hypothetical protein EV361DRAFT_955808 [Lentinula raphanica]
MSIDWKSENPAGIPTADSLPLYATYDPSSSLSRPFILLDSVKPSNHLSLSQTHNYIRVTEIIDPSRLEIPNEYLPPLAVDETEDTRNLYLLDDPTNAGLKKKVLLCTTSAHGFVYTTIARPTAPSRYTSLVRIEIRLDYGAVNVKIPRSFRGPVTGTTVHGSIVMSNTFIGDMNTRDEGIDDTLFLESTHGSIRIYFKDEDLTSPIVKIEHIATAIFPSI